MVLAGHEWLDIEPGQGQTADTWPAHGAFVSASFTLPPTVLL